MDINSIDNKPMILLAAFLRINSMNIFLIGITYKRIEGPKREDHAHPSLKIQRKEWNFFQNL